VGIGWAIGYAILNGRGITVLLSSGDILLRTLGGLAGAALWGAIGAGLGAITLIAWAGAPGIAGIALSVRQDIN
jgi:hypothetical protein